MRCQLLSSERNGVLMEVVEETLYGMKPFGGKVWHESILTVSCYKTCWFNYLLYIKCWYSTSQIVLFCWRCREMHTNMNIFWNGSLRVARFVKLTYQLKTKDPLGQSEGREFINAKRKEGKSLYRLGSGEGDPCAWHNITSRLNWMLFNFLPFS